MIRLWINYEHFVNKIASCVKIRFESKKVV